jgi:hypothetical protein
LRALFFLFFFPQTPVIRGAKPCLRQAGLPASVGAKKLLSSPKST